MTILYLDDVLEMVEGFGLVEDGHLYMGKLDAKKDKSIGIYNSKHEQPYRVAIGGHEMESYTSKLITVLVHWNKSARETEKAAMELYMRLEGIREINIGNKRIKFIRPLVIEPVDVGTDEAGVFEKVIEVEIIYER